MGEHMFVEVYRAKNNPQAVALKQSLEEVGIHAVVENELLQGAVGKLPMGWATDPRIMVDSRDAPKARELLERSERAATTAPSSADEGDEVAACLNCGTRLPDEDVNCPACGWSYKGGELEDEET